MSFWVKKTKEKMSWVPGNHEYPSQLLRAKFSDNGGESAIRVDTPLHFQCGVPHNNIPSLESRIKPISKESKYSDICAFANKMLRVTSELHSETVIKVDRIYRILTERFRIEKQRLEKLACPSRPLKWLFPQRYIASGSYQFQNKLRKSDFLNCWKMYLYMPHND